MSISIMSAKPRYFILVEKLTNSCPAGILLQEKKVSKGLIVCTRIDTDDKIHCHLDDVEQIEELALKFLVAIPNPSACLATYNDPTKMNDGIEMKSGSRVRVTINKVPALGVLKYKGMVSGMKGIQFGIELDPEFIGNTNGTVRKKKYFSCREMRGVFVSLDKVSLVSVTHLLQGRRLTTGSQSFKSHLGSRASLSSRLSSYSPATLPRDYQSALAGYQRAHLNGSGSGIPCDPISGITQEEMNEIGIFLGTRLTLRLDRQVSRGIVRFIGRLPDAESGDGDVYVGVSLDQPLGQGTGLYRKWKLFDTKPNHAALVSLDHVVSIDDSATSSFSSSGRETRRKSASGKRVVVVKQGSRKKQSSVRSPDQEKHSWQGSLESASTSSAGSEATSSSSSGGSGSREASNNNNNFPAVGSMVQMEAARLRKIFATSLQLSAPSPSGDKVYGLVRWIGRIPSSKDQEEEELTAGVELEEEIRGAGSGKLDGRRYFSGPHRRCIFLPASTCKPDSRFPIDELEGLCEVDGGGETTQQHHLHPPPVTFDPDSGGGFNRGIQGHNNSCYLDVVLFSLFAYSSCLDAVVFRNNPDNCSAIQKVLREEIVNPLRSEGFVSSDATCKLRQMMDEMTDSRGRYTRDQKDPEEFIRDLFKRLLRASAFYKLRREDETSSTDYLYQIFFTQDDNIAIPDTQLFVERSFLYSRLKFTSPPHCLILQMPRHGANFKMYKRVRASLVIDLKNVTERTWRECAVCGEQATHECSACSEHNSTRESLSSFCEECVLLFHRHPNRHHHNYKRLKLPKTKKEMREGDHLMELFSVVCIESNHYVCFTKCGDEWLFFDSMAGRDDRDVTVSLPRVQPCPDLPAWLALKDRQLMDLPLAEMAVLQRRLYCDAYLCMYRPLPVSAL